MMPSRRSLGIMDATPVLFAGPGAADADLEKLAKAKQFEASGVDRADILRSTGWWNDNGKWSFESSPVEPPNYNRPQFSKDRKSVPLSSMSDDPAFAASYPGLTETMVMQGGKGDLGPGDAALYLPKLGRPAPYIVLDARNGFSPLGNYFVQHEKQHAVDDHEGRLLPSMVSDRALPWGQKNSERRAVNGAYRDIYMTPEQRASVPPWESEQTAFQKMHPQYADQSTPSAQGAAVIGGAPVKGMYDEETLRRLGLMADPASMSRFGTSRGKGGLLDTLNDVGAPRGGGGSSPMDGQRSGRLEVLASAPGGGGGLLDAAPRQPSADMTGGDDRAIHDALARAKSPLEAEAILRSIAQDSGDAGLAAVDRIAKQYGLRTPWHRDFGKPPNEMGGLLGPSGRPRPLQRSDDY